MTKPLIVAIEPDRGQAAQLKAVVRARLHAELVLADTAEAALKALGDRIPDLVLTSAFLSPRDEAALAERLRTLDAAAAHVQTLTIPVLDAPKPANAARGMLSSILRDRGQSQAAPDGCDPAIFAEQCTAYLERAASERARQPAPNAVAVEESPAASHGLAVAPDSSEEASAAETSHREKWLETRVEPQLEPSFDARVDPPADSRIETPRDPAPDAPPRVNQPPASTFELDLSSMLDERVVHELSAAIETVTAAKTPTTRNAKAKRTGAAVARSANARKPEDEWGLFDPAQCGFATLLAKFDEVTQVAPPLPTGSLPAGALDVSR